MKDTIPHVHEDFLVSKERLSDFAEAHPEEQRATLIHRRTRSAYSPNEVLVVSFSVMLAVLALLYSMLDPISYGETLGAVIPLPAPAEPWIRLLIANAVLLLFPLTTVAFLQWIVLHGRRRRAIAKVWLSFYEDELALRRAAKGRAADRWRKAHPINWGG